MKSNMKRNMKSNMKSNQKKFIILCIVTAGLFTGCSASQQTASRVSSAQTDVADVLRAGIEAEETSSESTAEETKAAEAAETAKPDEAPKAEDAQTSDIPKPDVDLTELSSTMVYSEVFAMMSEPEQYMGKVIKMNGTCSRYTDIVTGADYYACLIKDAAACCSQGIEFQLPEGQKYPGMDENITVVGTFGSYMEDGNEYYVLLDSTVI